MVIMHVTNRRILVSADDHADAGETFYHQHCFLTKIFYLKHISGQKTSYKIFSEAIQTLVVMKPVLMTIAFM